MKVSGFLYALLTVTFFAGAMTVFFVQLGDSAGVDFDNETFSDYQQWELLTQQGGNLSENLNEVKSNNNVVDDTSFAASFIASAWKALKTTFSGVDIFRGMTSSALEDANVGNADLFRSFFYLLVLFLFFFAVLTLLFGRDA